MMGIRNVAAIFCMPLIPIIGIRNMAATFCIPSLIFYGRHTKYGITMT